MKKETKKIKFLTQKKSQLKSKEALPTVELGYWKFRSIGDNHDGKKEADR